MINNALNLVSRSLSKIGINHAAALPTPRVPELVAKEDENFSESSYIPTSSTVPPFPTDHPEVDNPFTSTLSDFNFSDIHVDADMLDGFWNLEPLNIHVGALEPSF